MRVSILSVLIMRLACGSWASDKLDILLDATFSGFDELEIMDDILPESMKDLAAEYLDTHEWTGRVSTQSVIASVIEDSSNQAAAALKILSDKEWHINCRMIKCCASVFRETYVSSLEQQKTPEGTMQWHAARGAGMWEINCAKIMHNFADQTKLKYLGMTPDTAAVTARIQDSTYLDAVIQARAGRFFNLAVCNASQHSWTMMRMSACPPTSAAAVMSSDAKCAKRICVRLRKLHDGLKHAQGLIDTDEEPAKLKDLLLDLYYKVHPLYNELMVLMKQANWSYKDPDVREQLWDLFCGISTTKRVLEDMFGRLKTIVTWQNRNRRINLHRIAAECSQAPTLADGCCGELWNLTDEDWATDTGVDSHDITNSLFHPRDHELEDELKDMGVITTSLF